VTLTQNGTTVDITVHLLDSNQFVKTGSADFEDFKFNAVGVVLGEITVNQTVAGQTLAAQTGSFNGDGTGNFSFGITCTTCGNGGAGAFSNDIIFHVANATIADLTQPNNLGNIFVADILSGTTGNTGPVDVSQVPRVAEPGTMILLGAGLVAVGLPTRRRWFTGDKS
jgi:hypothetical protein